MRFVFGIALAAASLMLAGTACAGTHQSVVWKCELAMEKMPSMISELERRIAAIPAGQRTTVAAQAIRNATNQADEELDSFSWYCGWGARGSAAARSMRGQLNAIRARFNLGPATTP